MRRRSIADEIARLLRLRRRFPEVCAGGAPARATLRVGSLEVRRRRLAAGYGDCGQFARRWSRRCAFCRDSLRR